VTLGVDARVLGRIVIVDHAVVAPNEAVLAWDVKVSLARTLIFCNAKSGTFRIGVFWCTAAFVRDGLLPQICQDSRPGGCEPFRYHAHVILPANIVLAMFMLESETSAQSVHRAELLARIALNQPA
jgi:hypothetical protein